MSTTTTKLLLVRPDGGDVISRAAHFNANWNIIDAAVGVAECTSASRPLSPYPGMYIRETDTLQTLVRNASNTTWNYVSAVPIVNNTSDITAPYNGQLCWNLSNFSMFVYRTSIAAWARYPSSDIIIDQQATNGTTTSTSYTTTLTGGTTCGIAFVAPPSGKVMVNNQMWISQSVAATYAYSTVRLLSGATIGSGSVIVSASDTNAVIASVAGYISVSKRTYFSSLTPLSNYNVQCWQKVSANTGNYQQKELSVEPI